MIENLSSSQSEWLTKQLNQINDSGIKNFSKLRLESSQRDFYRFFFLNSSSVILMVVPNGIRLALRVRYPCAINPVLAGMIDGLNAMEGGTCIEFLGKPCQIGIPRILAGCTTEVLNVMV